MGPPMYRHRPSFPALISIPVVLVVGLLVVLALKNADASLQAVLLAGYITF